MSTGGGVRSPGGGELGHQVGGGVWSPGRGSMGAEKSGDKKDLPLIL